MTNTCVAWDGDGTAVLAQWFFESGEQVEAGDVICEMMQEKAVIEVTAPVAGRLERRAVPDQEVTPGTVLASVSA